MIKNIVFDLGNVVLKENSGIVLNSLNIENNKKEIILDKFFNNSIHDNLDLGEVSLEEHYNNCNFDFDLDDDIKYKIIHFYEFRPFNNEIVDLIQQLDKNGYNIYILSDNNKETYEYLKKLEIFKCIKGWVVSCNHKVMKPNEKIYKILFDTYKLKPEECFFIDDKKENIEAAKFLGMSGFVLNLKKQGIKPLIDALEENEISIVDIS